MRFFDQNTNHFPKSTMNHVTQLQEQRANLLQRLAQTQQELNALDAEIETAEDEIRRSREFELEKTFQLDYNHFQSTHDRSIYDEALQRLEKMYRRLERKSGTVWDTFLSRGIQAFKVERATGDVYHTGKHPKCNIIRDPPHILCQKLGKRYM